MDNPTGLDNQGPSSEKSGTASASLAGSATPHPNANNARHAIDFLRNVRPTGPWWLQRFAPKPALREFGFKEISQLQKTLNEKYEERVNLYFQINPLRTFPTSGKAAMAEVEAMEFLHVDVDPPKIEGETWEQIEVRRAEIRALLLDADRLKALGVPGLPTYVIDSGGGFWALWQLIEPYPVAGETYQECHEEAHRLSGHNKWLAAIVNQALSTKMGDHCHNLDRVARLPYSMNYPDNAKLAAGRLPRIATLEYSGGERYTLDLFGYTEPGPCPPSKKDREAIRITGPSTLPSGDAWEVVEELGKKYPALPALTKQKILTGQDLDATEKVSRSQPLWHVILTCLRIGMPAPDVVEIISDPRFPISEHLRFPKDPKTKKVSRTERKGRSLRASAEHQVKNGIFKLKEEAEMQQALDDAADATVAMGLGEKGQGGPNMADQIKDAAKRASERFAVNGDGKKLPTESNYRIAFSQMGIVLRYNEFARRDEITGLKDFGPELTDKALNRLRLTVDRLHGFKMKKEEFFDMVMDFSHDARYHPVKDYLDGLKWDGVARLDSWLSTYGQAKVTPYTGAVGRLILLAAVRRIRQPGCKFDEMPILEGPQGTSKSEALKILAVRDDWFEDNLPLGANGKMMIEQTSGKWIIEIAEMHTRKSADVNEIKAQLSRSRDRAALKYEKIATDRDRQFVFFGTTNNSNYLKDPTGERRFWPVYVDGFDIEALKRDCDQLWAEAAVREAAGESIRMDRSLWAEAAEEQAARSEVHVDPWFDIFQEFFGQHEGKILSMNLYDIVQVPVERRAPNGDRRFAPIMNALGFGKSGAHKMRSSPIGPVETKKGYRRGSANQQFFVTCSEGGCPRRDLRNLSTNDVVEEPQLDFAEAEEPPF
jgi:hypothetical protein